MSYLSSRKTSQLSYRITSIYIALSTPSQLTLGTLIFRKNLFFTSRNRSLSYSSPLLAELFLKIKNSFPNATAVQAPSFPHHHYSRQLPNELTVIQPLQEPTDWTNGIQNYQNHNPTHSKNFYYQRKHTNFMFFQTQNAEKNQPSHYNRVPHNTVANGPLVNISNAHFNFVLQLKISIKNIQLFYHR